jgi:hypothetical protein
LAAIHAELERIRVTRQNIINPTMGEIRLPWARALPRKLREKHNLAGLTRLKIQILGVDKSIVYKPSWGGAGGRGGGILARSQ